jgi:tyrosine-protein kinase Etk/Wzc
MEAPINSNKLLDRNQLKTILRIVSKNWWILVSFVVASYIISYVYAYRLPDIYAAQTQLLLKSNDQYNSQSIISNTLGSFGSYQGFVDNANEIHVIQSYDLLRKVVDKLNMGISYFIEGRLRTTEVYTAIPFKVELYYINQGFYEKEIRLNILDKHHYRISYLRNDKPFSQEGTFSDDFINTDMKLHIIGNQNIINDGDINDMKETNYLFRIHNSANLVYRFQSALFVRNPDYTNILAITLKDIIPSRAVSFLDTLDKIYIENTLNTQFQLNSNTLYYIEKESAEVTDMIDTIETRIERYKEKKNILDLDKEAASFFQQYSDYNNAKSQLELQIGSLNDLEKYIIEDKDPEFLPPSVYINSDDEFLKKSTQDLYQMQLEKIGALNSSTLQNQAIINVTSRLDSLKQNLLIYIANSVKALNDRVTTVNTQIDSYIANIKTIPEKERGLLNIQMQEDVNVKLYQFLLEKHATTIIEKAAIIPQTRVIEQARSMGVVEPNRGRIYNIFMGIGALIALLIIFIRITFFDRIENIEQLKSKTNLPVIGEILSAPLIEELSIAIEDNPKSPLTESFRTLRTNLQYLVTNSPSKAILFTSNGPAEGKTFCSVNIAAILAKADKKVLLLEFDLHKPRIHKLLNIVPEKGLSTILIRKSSIEESILPTTISSMDTILCGPVPPNSSELILSERVKDIIDYGKSHYDYVIIDTPPLGLISDALVLMNFSDINLFVLNTKFAYKEAIHYIEELVNTNKIKNFAFVLNNVKRKRSKYYYNRYGYGYYGGYGYGYGSGGYGG